MMLKPTLLTVSLLAIGIQTCLANDKADDELPTTVLPNLYVTTAKPNLGKTVYNQDDLQNSPTTNKTISDVLKQHTAVQFNKTARRAGTQGEISAQDFSINGALYYDNKVLLNNVDTANQINPAGGSNPSANGSLPANSLDVTVNTDLLCSLEVLDSNVSAEYGQFVGGVVRANTCRPKTSTGKLKGGITYDYTSSDWTKFNPVNASEWQNFEDNTNNNYQKIFKKQGVSAYLQGNPTDKLGVQLSLSQRKSDIDLVSTLADKRPYNQERQTDNVLLGVDYDIDDKNSLKLNLNHTNSSGLYYQGNVADSRMDIGTKTDSLDLSFKHQLPVATLSHGLVYQIKEQARTTGANVSIPWRSSPNKNWSASSVATEGTAGEPLEHNQTKAEYHFKSLFNEQQLGGLTHRFHLGATLANEKADWYRPSDFWQYYVPTATGAGGTNCKKADGTTDAFCDTSYIRNGKTVGQLHTRRVLYQAGQIHIRQTSVGAFAENQWRYGNLLKGVAGVRYDYDDLSKKSTVAPRLSATYYPFHNDKLALDVGYNRYYGRNAFTYALQDGINQLNWEETRTNLNADWQRGGHLLSSNVARNTLKIPHSDEKVVGISGELYNTDWQLKYVHRDYKDQIRRFRVSLSPTVWSYDNLGQSQADTYSLTIANKKPIEFLGANHKFSFGTSFSDVKRNFNDYDDSTLNEDKYILYDGKVIANIDRPADNFNQPWTVRVGWELALQKLPLTIANQVRYRSDYKAMVASSLPVAERFTYEGETVRLKYSPTHIGSNVDWDMKLGYQIKLAGDKKANLGLTINNLLNRQNKYLNGTTLESEVGRQFLAEIGFKF